MQDKEKGMQRLKKDIASVAEFIDSAQMHVSGGRNEAGVPGTPDECDRSSIHQVLDLVESVAHGADDILQELKVLRKALPAIYFKNRSRIRGAFERIEAKADSNRENALSIMEALQCHDIMRKSLENTRLTLEVLKDRLNAASESLSTSGVDSGESVRQSL